MLSEGEIRALEGQIGTAVRDDQRHHENLQNLLQQFQSLLQSYNGLKSDYEEEKANREKWKNLAKGQVSLTPSLRHKIFLFLQSLAGT